MDRLMMVTGDKCHVAGTYWSSGCGHADVGDFQLYDVFPTCKTCFTNIAWILHPRFKTISEAKGIHPTNLPEPPSDRLGTRF